MSEPINNLLRGLAPDQRRRITNALMADQYNRPTPQDGPVTERADMFPLGTYANGQTGIAWPGFIAQPVESFVNLLRRGYQGGTGDTQGVQDAFNVAGGAMTGGLLAPRPRGSLGTSGRPHDINKQLDMSPEARKARAEAMGFDTRQVWYHGSDALPFDQFEFGHAGASSSIGRPGLSKNAIYFADNKSHAGSFGDTVEQFYVRGRTMDVDASDGFAQWAKELGFDNPQQAIDRYYDGSIYTALNLDDKFADFARKAKKEGYDNVRVSLGGLSGDSVDGSVLIALDPRNIRSVNALFDPDKINSANLLAANSNPLAAALAAYYGGNGQSGGR